MDLNSNQRMSLASLPSDVFNQCPRCESLGILKFEGEAFCLRCDWDSVRLHVDCQVFGYRMLNRQWPILGVKADTQLAYSNQ
ncbi:hypothetical protein WDW86_10120 [Bdellovibrionota bacterium FG-2]